VIADHRAGLTPSLSSNSMLPVGFGGGLLSAASTAFESFGRAHDGLSGVPALPGAEGGPSLSTLSRWASSFAPSNAEGYRCVGGPQKLRVSPKPLRPLVEDSELDNLVEAVWTSAGDDDIEDLVCHVVKKPGFPASPSPLPSPLQQTRVRFIRIYSPFFSFFLRISSTKVDFFYLENQLSFFVCRG
jgi:hypothetical protein